jgi:predicted thioesterase
MAADAVRVGLEAANVYTVGADDTARVLGSGSLDVLATPRLLAWMEAQTCAAIDGALLAGDTSVGTRITLEHLRPSVVGAEVEVTSRVVHVDGRLVRLETVAQDDGVLCGRAEISRVIVDRERFVARLPGSLVRDDGTESEQLDTGAG